MDGCFLPALKDGVSALNNQMTGPSTPTKPEQAKKDHAVTVPSRTGAQDSVARPERFGPDNILLYPARLGT